MSENENTTNEPTIKLPVRYDKAGGKIRHGEFGSVIAYRKRPAPYQRKSEGE